jgi:hypothetical protein
MQIEGWLDRWGMLITLNNTCIAVPSRNIGKYDNSWQRFLVF